MRSNNAPFTDVCSLIAVTTEQDSDGYESTTETSREVFCSVCDGVVRSEFYEAYKAGIRLSLTVEIWEDDYQKETILEHDGNRYQIERTYPSGHGTLELSCSEVVR